jgi:heme exporter protein D
MDLGPHVAFIVAAYVATALIILVLIAWIAADYRAQQRALAELEQQGVTRRSARSSRDFA